MERRLAAILAADMVGYSRLMEADERRPELALAPREIKAINAETAWLWEAWPEFGYSAPPSTGPRTPSERCNSGPV